MSDLEQQLSKLVERAIEAAEKTGEFVIEQAPDLLREFYAWHIAENVMLIILSVLLMLTGRYLPYLWLNEKDDYDDLNFFSKSGDDGAAVAWAFFIVFFGTGITLFIVGVWDLIFILVAPKLYLIEYFVK